MSSPTEASERRAVLLTMAACLVCAVAAVAVALVFGSPEEKGKGKTRELTVSAAEVRCAATTPENLKGASLAFEGTVVEVDGDQAVFEVHHWYQGEEAEEVEVEAENARLFGAPLVVDSTYLVAGDGDEIRPCGTGEATLDLRSAYENAFGED